MPRCKHCKEKFEPKQFLQKFCKRNLDCHVAEGLYNLEKQKKKDKKTWNQWKESVRPSSHSKENKKELQKEINKLARLIDLRFAFNTCIDCGKTYGKQQDGGHFNSVGSNATLRYNLNNIHSQKSDCNRNGLGGGRRLEYYRGLIQRYGQEYADFVDTGLQIKYKHIGLNEVEIYEKLKLVRKIVRDFETYKFKNSVQARNMLNKIIGIYE